MREASNQIALVVAPSRGRGSKPQQIAAVTGAAGSPPRGGATPRAYGKDYIGELSRSRGLPTPTEVESFLDDPSPYEND